MVKISGRLVEPADDKPRSGVTLILSSVKNSSVVLKHATYRCVTGGNGEYSFNAAPGTYAVAVSVYGAESERVGLIRVYSDSLPGDLNSFLMAPAEDDLTPEIIRLVDSMRSEAVKAAESAKQSEQVTSQLASDVATHAEQVASNTVVVEQKTTIATDAAATAVAAKEQASKDALATGKDRQATQTKAQEAAASANAAKAAQDSIVEDAADVRDKALQVAENTTLVANNAAAVQLNTEQVAQNTQTVTTKTQQVSENAQAVAANTLAVTQMRDEVVAKTSMAQAAADTATQKAASAAEHDAAAAEYARQAQEAAQATAGALIDGGAADLSTGVYPQPVQVSGTARPTFWKVTKGGTVGGVDYGVGDTLIYTVAGSGSYYKIDNTESVTSVQGEKGAVTLTPEKIGAEVSGTAVALIHQHTSIPDPHTQYAKKTDVDASGTAQQKISEHTAAPDPHPKYALKSSLGSAAYKSTAGLFSSAPLMEQYYWDFRTIASYDVPFAFPIGVSAGISPASRVGASGDYVSMLSCIGYVDYSGYESMAQWFASNNLNGIGVRVPYPVST
ncbi:MAG: prophage tail fiber N-terminal domain-containing protein, partial [Plesiomonas shigelloides]